MQKSNTIHALRLALAQINLTVGDIDGNTEKIMANIGLARDRGADLVIFPELAITGYPPEDLLLKQSFVDDNLAALDRVREAATAAYRSRTTARGSLGARRS